VYGVYKVVLIGFFLQKHAFITGENSFQKIRGRSKPKDAIYNDIMQMSKKLFLGGGRFFFWGGGGIYVFRHAFDT
jgi:hypothetical protein